MYDHAVTHWRTTGPSQPFFSGHPLHAALATYLNIIYLPFPPPLSIQSDPFLQLELALCSLSLSEILYNTTSFSIPSLISSKAEITIQ